MHNSNCVSGLKGVHTRAHCMLDMCTMKPFYVLYITMIFHTVINQKEKTIIMINWFVLTNSNVAFLVLDVRKSWVTGH